MITKDDLEAAIAECLGVRNPSANTCIKLAAYYTILNEIRNKPNQGLKNSAYSFDGQVENSQRVVNIDSDSEFADAIRGMNEEKAWLIMDELMGTLYVINQPFYNKVLRRISESM